MSESSRGRAKKIVAPRGKGRRTQTERDQLSQAEKERNKERDAQYAAEQNAARLAAERAERDKRRRAEAAARSGRGRGGRGGFMGDSRHEISSGPLSGGSNISSHIASGKAFPRPWAPSNRGGRGGASVAGPSGSGGGGGGGGSGIKRDPDMNFATADIDAGEFDEDGGYVSSDPDEPEHGQRRPIETINLISDDEEDEDRRQSRTVPTRLTRVDHRDRGLQVSTEASEGTKIKTEDGDTEMTDAPTSTGRKAKQRDASIEIIEERPWRGVWQDPEEPIIKPEPSVETSPSRSRGKAKEEPTSPTARRMRKIANKAPELFNPEERSEYERELRDDEVMLSEFGDPEKDKDTTRTYLFQFPPILPNLVIQKPIVIKDDPDAPAPALGSETQTGATNKDAPIKIEEDDTTKKISVADKAPRPKHLPELASGAVGKLRVHKSGKVTMNWGGSSFVVQNGVSPQFLQSLVMITADAQVPLGALPSDTVGVATALGQPRGKLVVQPDWDEMLAGVKGLKVE